VRSKANIEAGATGRLSAILHGVWMLLAVVCLAPVLRHVPLAALAGLLVVIGLKLIDPKHLRELHGHGEVWVWAATFFGVVSINLLAGIGLGFAVATLQLCARLAGAQVTLRHSEGLWHVAVRGAATFLLMPRLVQTLASIPVGAPVVVRIDAPLVDHAASSTLSAWRQKHESSGGWVRMKYKGVES
jgi:carbonic anhydrase